MKTFFDELNELERGMILQALEISVDVYEDQEWDDSECSQEDMMWSRSKIAQMVLIYRRHGGTLTKEFCQRLKHVGSHHFRDCFRDYSRIDDGVVMVQLPWMENESVDIMLGKEIVSDGCTTMSFDDRPKEEAFMLYDLVDKAIVREECLEQGDYCNRSLRVMIEQYNEGRRNK